MPVRLSVRLFHFFTPIFDFDSLKISKKYKNPHIEHLFTSGTIRGKWKTCSARREETSRKTTGWKLIVETQFLPAPDNWQFRRVACRVDIAECRRTIDASLSPVSLPAARVTPSLGYATLLLFHSKLMFCTSPFHDRLLVLRSKSSHLELAARRT